MFRSIRDRLIRKIAFVSPGEDSVPPQLLRLHRFCGENVPPPRTPKEIVVLQALPRNRAGKVLKRNLRTL